MQNLSILLGMACLVLATSISSAIDTNDNSWSSSSSSFLSATYHGDHQHQHQHQQHRHSTQPQRLRRTQTFYQVPAGKEEWQECVDQLYVSDANNDLELDEDEYTSFIATRSRGEIAVGRYQELPFSLISCFVYGACFCSVWSFMPDCCVGTNAHIELNTEVSPLAGDNLITVCQAVDDAIEQIIGTFPPISAPPTTMSPTVDTSSSPTSSPTDIVSSDAPSMVPSAVPTLAPTAVVSSDSPSMVPSDVPISSPTVIVSSDAPSLVPSNQPTGSQTTSSPSESPSMMVTVMNSTAPSSFPSDMPSSSPTAVSSDVPSSQPSMETMMPTPEALTCVNFQYGIQNDAGFDADDIFNEVNNTLKTGLIIATENVTIEVLNATFPRSDDGSGRFRRRELMQSLQSSSRQMRQPDQVVDHHLLREKDQMERFNGNTMLITNLVSSTPASQSHEQQRSLVYVPQSSSSSWSAVATATQARRRRLVYYTDVFEPVINTIFDNPLCNAPEGFQCAVVDSTVCVILEEGDDEDEVRLALLTGIGAAIEDGSFFAAIPPEHNLPGGGERIDL